MLERDFQASVIKELKDRFPGCVVMKNDPNYIQGIPDLLVLYQDKWAALECKKSSNAGHQSNQDYYIDILGDMSYAAFLYPENREEIMNELEQTFRRRRNTRVSKR